MIPLNEKLKILRTRKNILQQEIADKIGLSLRSYQRYEKGEREPTVSILIAFADYYDVSLDYLVGRSDNPERN